MWLKSELKANVTAMYKSCWLNIYKILYANIIYYYNRVGRHNATAITEPQGHEEAGMMKM